MKYDKFIDFLFKFQDKYLGLSKKSIKELLKSGNHSVLINKISRLFGEFRSTSEFLMMKEISGSESLIFFREGDDKFIYKKNNPLLKIEENDSNSVMSKYIISLLIQEFMFPECRYKILGVDDDYVWLRQRMLPQSRPTQDKIDQILSEAEFINKGSYWLLEPLDGYLIAMYDLNPLNCRVIKGELYAFDGRYKLIVDETN